MNIRDAMGNAGIRAIDGRSTRPSGDVPPYIQACLHGEGEPERARTLDVARLRPTGMSSTIQKLISSTVGPDDDSAPWVGDSHGTIEHVTSRSLIPGSELRADRRLVDAAVGLSFAEDVRRVVVALLS